MLALMRVLWALLMLAAGEAAGQSVAVSGLRTEHAENPLGVDTPSPRLSWLIQSSRRGEVQSAYQVLVADSEERLRAGQGNLWDSGKVPSSRSVLVPYGGKPLASRQRCYWKVRVWGKDGQPSPYSAPAWWEMGLLSPRDWTAEWIGYPAGWNGRALYLRRDFELDKPVRSARAYIAGLGYYELRLNGRKVGDHVLDPGVTDYSKRILYSTYDVTNYLRSGRNAVGIIAGNGWYGMPKALLQLEVTFQDGSRQTVVTRGMRGDWSAGGWRATSGPIGMNSIYDGEEYDARREKPGWDSPDPPAVKLSLDRTERWATAMPVEPPGGRMVSQSMEPIRVVESLKPRSVRQPKPGIYVFDSGQNLAGWAELRVRGPRGARVTLRFAENLNDDGTVNQDNLRKAAATDTYIPNAGEEEVWEPRFTYHGFRYVQVEGFPGAPTPDNITIKAVRSDVLPNGVFECSSPLLNRIQKMVWWTEASNLHSIPTDCPQRDERMGWLNDLTVRLEESVYNFHLARFYAKFLDDVRDTQAADGSITDTAPFRWGRRPADPVSASYLLLAWTLYEHYGDTRPMAKHFDGFKAWVDFLDGMAKENILSYGSWGDWSPPVQFGVPGSIGAGARSKDTPLELTSTGYLYYSMRLLARMAGVLGKKAEAERYEVRARAVEEAFNRRFWNEQTGGYGANNQAANSLALFLGVVPKERIPRVAANLANDVRKHDNHLTTGNLCTKYLLEMLTEHGHAGAAFDVASQETYPSWGFMLARGATTLWERWEHATGAQMNSHNHPMMGSVSSWFYKYLAGIRVDPRGPGFRRFIIRPYPVEGLTWARGEYQSPYGLIRCAWKREGSEFRMSVSAPPNSTATVFVPVRGAQTVTEGGRPAERAEGLRFLRREPDAVVYEAGSGEYEFVVR